MIDELNDCIYKVRELFDMAFDYNQNDKFRTELSRKCTDYLVDVEQTLAAIRDQLKEVNKKRNKTQEYDSSGWDFHWDGRGSYEESRRCFYGDFS